MNYSSNTGQDKENNSNMGERSLSELLLTFGNYVPPTGTYFSKHLTFNIARNTCIFFECGHKKNIIYSNPSTKTSFTNNARTSICLI